MILIKFWAYVILLFKYFHTSQSFDGCLCVEKFAGGLQLPIDLVHANDGSNRIFVAEIKGIASVYYANGTKLQEPLIDVTEKIGDLGKVTESGLSSLAFHPNFKSNGLFYALISTKPKPTQQGVNHYSNLFEFKISATDINKADPNYSRKLLTFVQPAWSHNVDQLLFGTDGLLHVFIGDGGIQKDPSMWAQNMDKHLGKILRIDVDSRTGTLPYGIPEDNPFNNGSYSIPEIYALGVRNPWRGGMDRGDRLTGEGRGRIIFGDVGQGYVEELDLLEIGANYEWNIKEANLKHCKNKYCLKGPGKFTPPIYSYTRKSKLGKAVVGGQFYRGCRSPKLNGIYFWGDYDSGLLFRLKEDKDTGTWQNKEVEMCDPNVCKDPLQSSFNGHMTSFGLNEEGEVYMLTSQGRHPYKKNGHVYRLVEPSQPGDPEPCKVGTTTELKSNIQKQLEFKLKQIKHIDIPKPNKSVAKILNEDQYMGQNSDFQPGDKKAITKPSTPKESVITTTQKTPTPQPLQRLKQGKEGSSVQTNTQKVNSKEHTEDAGVVVKKDEAETMESSEQATENAEDILGNHNGKVEAATDKEDTAVEARQDRSKTMDGYDDKANGSDNAEQGNDSATDSRDGSVKSKLNSIMDIIKTGSDNLKGTLAKFLGKLLARLHHADVSDQDADIDDQELI